MASGRLAKAGRGELAFPLPAGYVRRPSGEVALDPDEQVQAVVRLVFRLFEQLGTVHAVLRFLVEHQVQIGMRERSGPGKGEIVWRAPHQTGLINLLRNPAYAGIYAYGRSRTDPSRRLPGHQHSGRVRRLDAEQWLVRIDGALPGYISVGQYQRNLARLAANRARAAAAGAPRNGPALLGGLVVCGICGHRMQVSYERNRQGLTGRYCCQRRHHTYGQARCQQMAARCLDDHVVAHVLSALAPAALELSVAAARQVEARRAEVDRIWRQRLERAGFLCGRARRQYQLAEPENRLVVRQLEREWEAALAERARLGEEYQRQQRQRPARLSAAELAAIRALAGDIPALWAASTTTVADRKRLLRAIIESVQVTADGATERVHATVTWAGGHQTHATPIRPVARIDQLSYYPALTQRIRVLAGEGLGNAAIADRLAIEGFRTPHLHERFHVGEIQHLIRRLGLRPGLDGDHRTGQGSLGHNQWWLATLAGEIGMPTATAAPAAGRLPQPAPLDRRRHPDRELRQTRSLMIMREKPYGARTEATPSPPGSGRGRSRAAAPPPARTADAAARHPSPGCGGPASRPTQASSSARQAPGVAPGARRSGCRCRRHQAGGGRPVPRRRHPSCSTARPPWRCAAT
jgi:hypothetical protein